MKKLFNSEFFIVYLFVILFFIINFYVVFNIDIKELYSTYIYIYTAWFLIIILLKVVSHFSHFEEEDHV